MVQWNFSFVFLLRNVHVGTPQTLFIVGMVHGKMTCAQYAALSVNFKQSPRSIASTHDTKKHSRIHVCRMAIYLGQFQFGFNFNVMYCETGGRHRRIFCFIRLSLFLIFSFLFLSLIFVQLRRAARIYPPKKCTNSSSNPTAASTVWHRLLNGSGPQPRQNVE